MAETGERQSTKNGAHTHHLHPWLWPQDPARVRSAE